MFFCSFADRTLFSLEAAALSLARRIVKVATSIAACTKTPDCMEDAELLEELTATRKYTIHPTIGLELVSVPFP